MQTGTGLGSQIHFPSYLVYQARGEHVLVCP